MGTPTGGPNFDDKIGLTELRFTSDEFQQAANGAVVHRSVEISGDGGKYGLTFEARHLGWRDDAVPLPGQAVFDKTAQQIAAVSRGPNNLDLFVIGNDGHPYSASWNSSGWHEAFALPGQAVFDVQHQRIAAVSRGPNNLDLFAIGNDGHIWTTFWNSAGWNKDWFPLPGQAVFDKTAQQIAAVSRGPNNLDLFVIGNDGHIWNHAWTV